MLCRPPWRTVRLPLVADQAGAYWLLDEHTIIQPHERRVAAEEFQASNCRAFASPRAGVLPLLLLVAGRLTPSIGLPMAALHSQR